MTGSLAYRLYQHPERSGYVPYGLNPGDLLTNARAPTAPGEEMTFQCPCCGYTTTVSERIVALNCFCKGAATRMVEVST
jgi:hypothetical protein